MNEEQADLIISLLEEIRNTLNNIEMNTMEISSIDSNVSDASDYLRTIKNKT